MQQLAKQSSEIECLKKNQNQLIDAVKVTNELNSRMLLQLSAMCQMSSCSPIASTTSTNIALSSPLCGGGRSREQSSFVDCGKSFVGSSPVLLLPVMSMPIPSANNTLTLISDTIKQSNKVTNENRNSLEILTMNLQLKKYDFPGFHDYTKLVEKAEKLR